MTFKKFQREFQRAWEDGFSYTAFPITGKELDSIIDNHRAEFHKSKYTEAVNKEVEALWSRKYTKLGKSLS